MGVIFEKVFIKTYPRYCHPACPYHNRGEHVCMVAGTKDLQPGATYTAMGTLFRRESFFHYEKFLPSINPYVARKAVDLNCDNVAGKI